MGKPLAIDKVSLLFCNVTNSSVSIIVESDDHDIALTAARIHHHQLGNTLTCVHLSDARVCILKSIQLKHKLGIIHTATCKCELRSYHFKKKIGEKNSLFFLIILQILNELFSQEQNQGIVLHQGDSFYCLAVNHLL